VGESSIMEKDYLRAQASGITYHFYIHGEIGESSEYVDLLDVLYNANANDSIILHLNTVGGYLNTAVEILHAMAQTEATVTTSADGLVASAGSLIFFAGHSFQVGEFCEIMLHDGSGGEIGKINENLKSAVFTSKRLERIYHNIYGRFFSKKDVNKILQGQDLYLDADDVEKIIHKAFKKAVKEIKEALDDEAIDE
jgi:ATP-dependent protease ClpP protease subunit